MKLTDRKVTEKLEERAALLDRQRGMVDKARDAGRDLNADESQTYDAIDADIDKLEDEIRERRTVLENAARRREALDARSASDEFTRGGRITGGRIDDGDTDDDTDDEENPFAFAATRQYRRAFLAYLRRGAKRMSAEQARVLSEGLDTRAALQIGTDAEGGYITGEEFERGIVETMDEASVMRGLATVIRTAGDRKIPVESSIGSATWTAEEAAYTEDEPVFAQSTLAAHKLARIQKVSEELLGDSLFDLVGYLTRVFGRSFVNAEENAFVQGDGSGKPTGVTSGATAVVTAAGTAAITVGEVHDLFYGVKSVYARNGTWLAHRTTVKAIRLLQDGAGAYIWQPSLTAGDPDTILGRPVAPTDDMPTMATGNVSLVFGDLSHYWIADRQMSGLQRLDELYAATGQVGFKMFRRVDGKVILAEAIGKLTQA